MGPIMKNTYITSYFPLLAIILFSLSFVVYRRSGALNIRSIDEQRLYSRTRLSIALESAMKRMFLIGFCPNQRDKLMRMMLYNGNSSLYVTIRQALL